MEEENQTSSTSSELVLASNGTLQKAGNRGNLNTSLPLKWLKSRLQQKKGQTRDESIDL